ncbi:MAG: hypothetical protein M3503_03660 [Actinomycetota bacterium]|nr:hypothetical protein [Actinomycetota bacterium]
MNLSVAAGHLSRPPERRTLPSGEELVSYDLSVAGPADRVESVPVSWPSPPTSAADLGAGDAVLVVGRVRRRFFRAGGSTQSRTEVVATAVVPLRRKSAVKRLLLEAAAVLEDPVVEPTPKAPRRRPVVDQVADAS